MAIIVLKETGASRSSGFNVANGQTIYPGFLCALDSSADDTIKLYNDKTVVPAGFALESNVIFPYSATDAPAGTPIGDGYDFLNYNRGGLIGLFRNGGEILLYDDKRAASGASHPVDYTQSYAVNAKVYADETTGKVTSDSATSTRKEVGIVEKVIGSGSTMQLRIRLSGTLA